MYVVAAPGAVRRRRHDLVGQVGIGGLDVGDQRGQVERQRPVLGDAGLPGSASGVSLTGLTVIDTVSVVDVSGSSHPAGAPQLSGSPRSVTWYVKLSCR